MERPVAAFELDALYPEPLTKLFVDRMIEAGHFPATARSAYAAPEATRLALLGRFLKGVPFTDAEEVAGTLIEEGKGRAFSYPMSQAFELKSRGYFLLAISGAPRFLVDGFAYEAGFDKSYGSYFATGASDRFTGAVEDEDVITNRAAVLTRAVRKENLTLRDSYGLAGSASFIPLLEMVGAPLAFNPDHELKARAEKRGWKTVLEEGGVVYKL